MGQKRARSESVHASNCSSDGEGQAMTITCHSESMSDAPPHTHKSSCSSEPLEERGCELLTAHHHTNLNRIQTRVQKYNIVC